MKPLMESWRRYLTEGVEKGKKFEYVVVQTVRQSSGAGLLTGGDYDKWEEWAQLGSKTTLKILANELYDTAVKSGLFETSDFQNARVTDLGRQRYANQGGRIEVKTDALFGDKTVSIKMSGDTQADTSKLSALQIKASTALNKAVEETEDATIKKVMESVFDNFSNSQGATIKKLAERRFLGNRRARGLSKALEDPSLDPKKREINIRVLEEMKKLALINEEYELINEEYRYDEEKLAGHVKRSLFENFKREDGTLQVLIRELLTGAAGFQHVEGAAAQYLLSPQHAFDLHDDEAIEIFCDSIKLRIALKGDRPLGIKEIDGIRRGLGSEVTARWDIKENLLKEAIKKRANNSKKKVEALLSATGEDDIASTPLHEGEPSYAGDSFDNLYDELTLDLKKVIENT